MLRGLLGDARRPDHRRLGAVHRAVGAARTAGDARAVLGARAARGGRARRANRRAAAGRQPQGGRRRPDRQLPCRAPPLRRACDRRRLRHVATCVDVVSAKGEFLGGVIAPGLEISVGRAGVAVRRRCARSSWCGRVRWSARTRVECMQSGAIFGFAGLVDGLVRPRARRAAAFAGNDVTVIATGDGRAADHAGVGHHRRTTNRTSRSRACAWSTSATMPDGPRSTRRGYEWPGFANRGVLCHTGRRESRMVPRSVVEADAASIVRGYVTLDQFTPPGSLSPCLSHICGLVSATSPLDRARPSCRPAAAR